MPLHGAFMLINNILLLLYGVIMLMNIIVHCCSILRFLMRSVVMEQHTLKNVNNCLNTNIYSYLETSGGQSSNLYLNAVHFFNTSVN